MNKYMLGSLICGYRLCGKWCPFLSNGRCVAHSKKLSDIISIFIDFYETHPDFKRRLDLIGFDWEDFQNTLSTYSINME